MSLYHMVRGVNNATFFVLPALGVHAEAFPRFRDCFVRQQRIVVLTRTGGGNRAAYQAANAAIQSMPGFVSDADDSFDSTFATWEFAIPVEWQADIDYILHGRLSQVRTAYRERFYAVYPKLLDRIPERFWDEDQTEGWGQQMVYGDTQTPFDSWPGLRERGIR